MTPPPQVQPDMSEVFVPVVEGFLVTVDEAQTHLKTLMELIPTLHGQEKKAESVMLPAIQVNHHDFANFNFKPPIYDHSFQSRFLDDIQSLRIQTRPGLTLHFVSSFQNI